MEQSEHLASEHITTIFRVSCPSFTLSTTSYEPGLVVDLEKYIELPQNERTAAVDALRKVCTNISDITHLWIVNDAVTGPIWDALRLLTNVKRLEIRAGTERSSNISQLDEIGKDWPLESICIEGVSFESLCNSKLSTINELQLWSSDSLVPPPGIEGQLRRLHIIYGTSCDQFVTLARHTRLLKDLEELVIHSITNDDFQSHSRLDFLKCIQELKSLKTLSLVFSDRSAGPHIVKNFPPIRPDFFPENLECLNVVTGPRVSKYLGHWWKCLRDPNWLPKLKEFNLSSAYTSYEEPSWFSSSQFSDIALSMLYGDLRLEEERKNMATLSLGAWDVDKFGDEYNHMGSSIKYSLPAIPSEIDDGETEPAEEYVEKVVEGEVSDDVDDEKLASYALMQCAELLNELQILRKDVVVHDLWVH